MKDEKVEQRERQSQQLQDLNAQRSEDWLLWFRQCLFAEFKRGNPIFDSIAEAFAMEREVMRKEFKKAIDEERRNSDGKLKDRLKSTPGKLPIAKAWQPESVTYSSEYRTHEGGLWQSRKDTAQAPGGADWVCVARAGRDAITPKIRGTFEVGIKYKHLDVVASDGGAFIARKDDPGLCPGDGWQLLSRQGRRGPKGERGECGLRGEKGDPAPAVMPQLISSEIDANFNLSILRSDNSLEVIPLREAFERYYQQTGE